MNGYVNEAKVTPLMVTAGPFMLNAATSVPSVRTSLSPEMFVGVPQVMTEPSAHAHAGGPVRAATRTAAPLTKRSFLAIGTQTSFEGRNWLQKTSRESMRITEPRIKRRA